MLSARSVASYFIDQSSQLTENDLTNLKLQKILFYAQAESLASAGDPLFEEPIEAWKYGPVVRSVYDWLKGCGAYPVTTFDVEADYSDVDESTVSFLRSVWEKYNKYSAGYLVDKTHEDGSPWKETYEDGKSNIIPNGKIAEAHLQAEWA